MTASNNNYNVLIQVKDQNESERLISAFRSAGITVRAHRVTSEQDFKESLQDGSWDLLVVDNKHPEVSIQFSAEAINTAQLQTPIIMLGDGINDEAIERALKLGVADVVNKSDEKHFVFAAQREMNKAQSLRQFSELKAEFDELNSRAEMLLAESDDAIAYVSDGIITELNENFAKTFGYDDVDDLDCASIIDLVAGSDQDKFKNFMRHFQKGDIDQTELEFNAVKDGGDEFPAFMVLANSTVEGEPCIQVNIKTNSGGGGSASGSGTVDTATELNNRYAFTEKITSTAIQVGKTVPNASLLVYKVDDYDNLLDDVFFSGIDSIIKDLGQQLKTHMGECYVARVGDDAVGAIVEQKDADALELAKTTIKAIEDHILEFPGRTIQYTCSCSIIPLQNKEASLLLDSVIEGISTIRLDNPKNSAGIFTPPEREAPKPGADDIASIEEALELGSFKLLYQPMMSLQGDEMENYEVRVWLSDGEHADVYPTDMINAATNSKLDRWIILEATKTLSQHHAEGHNTRLLVNLTVNALKDDGIAAWLGVAIKAANLNNDHLIFQFNEEDVRNNLKSAIKSITAFQDAGFKVSMGNFGEVEDPFKVLNHFKLNQIMFSTKYTESISSGETDDLKALIGTAKENEIPSIIPDVDNAGALATLWQLGVHYIMGSYMQSPSPVMNYEFTEIA